MTFGSSIFCGFRTEAMLPMLMYDSEPALHRSCCHSSKQHGSTSLGMWQEWATCTTCSELYIRWSAGWPRSGGATQDVHVTPGYGPWKPTFSRSTMDWTQRGDMPKIKDDRDSLWKWLRSSPGLARDDDDESWSEAQSIIIIISSSQGRRKRYGRYGGRHTNPKFGMATPYQSKVNRRTCLSFVTSHG